MVIHFTASDASVVNDIGTLRKVMAVIHRMSHILARDWIEPQYHIMISKAVSLPDSEQIFKLNIDAIERSDLIIVEGSEKSFGSGFQIATALQKKKPTLLLVAKDRDTEESTFSQGVRHDLLQRAVYTSDNLEKIVSGFIKENEIATKDLRFNFVIDRQLYNHIRWKSYHTKKTKAEIVRELLEKDMNEGVTR